jgi:hypothetical protein
MWATRRRFAEPAGRIRFSHAGDPRLGGAATTVGDRAAFDEFRLDRQGELDSLRTLEFYDDRIGQFLAWLAEERPEVRRMQDLDVGVVREYRAYVSGRLKRSGRPIRPKTAAESQALMAFLKWAKAEGYEVELGSSSSSVRGCRCRSRPSTTSRSCARS